MRRSSVHLFLPCILFVTVWLILLSLEQLDHQEQGDAGTNSAGGGAELRRGTLRFNSSVFLQTLAAQRRPLLVRFDWYSRKTTPVHIG